MERFKYLIIGAGMTGDAAARGIRQVDPDGSIGIIGKESDPPYNRPPLSKGLWKGKTLDSIWRKTEKLRVTLRLGRKIKSLNVSALTAEDEQGVIYHGEKLLLATGGMPRRLPFGGNAVIYYRNLKDYQRLKQISAAGDHFAVIGGGFIGSEVAAALAMNGKKVTLLFPGEGIGDRVFPADLSQYVTRYFREKGVEVLTGQTVKDLKAGDHGYTVITGSGQEIIVDGVVAGVGIQPNIALAQEAGLNLGNGIIVDEFLRTSQTNIYAAGDAAEFYNPALGKRLRVEHEDNANSMGLQAGRNMAGAAEPYHHLPFFYSDLFDLSYEAVGELDPRLTTVTDWKEPYEKGVVYYLENSRVRGVLLWNVWSQIANARRLIADPGPFTPENIRGRMQEKMPER
jgi:3-phenylpropionate/trans-cinnamate dioxygenase ferredoxin reductase component